VVPSELLAARAQVVLDMPLHRLLGMRLRDPADPSAGLWFPVTGPAVNQAGLLHAGVVYTLLDIAALLALFPHLSAEEHAVTHDLTVSVLRPVAAEERVDVTGSVLRRGRAVAFLRADATVGGGLVAAAQVTKSVVPA
jgi:uncharacterized protein (TIGR00369 family)